MELSEGEWEPTITDTFINVHVYCKTDFVLMKGCLFFNYAGKASEYTKDVSITDSTFVGNTEDRCLRIFKAKSVTIRNTSFKTCGIKNNVRN